MDKPLTKQLREATQWCAGEQAHTPYSDADYVRLFREAAGSIASERDARERLDVAMRGKDRAMSVLFDRLHRAGVDTSDLIA